MGEHLLRSGRGGGGAYDAEVLYIDAAYAANAACTTPTRLHDAAVQEEVASALAN